MRMTDEGKPPLTDQERNTNCQSLRPSFWQGIAHCWINRSSDIIRADAKAYKRI